MNEAVQVGSLAIQRQKLLILKLSLSRCFFAHHQCFAHGKALFRKVQLFERYQVKVVLEEVSVDRQQEVVALQRGEPLDPRLDYDGLRLLLLLGSLQIKLILGRYHAGLPTL